MNNSPNILPQAAKPSSCWGGCAETLADPYKGRIVPSAKVNAFQEPFASPQVIQQDTPNIGGETHMKYSFPPIATE
jgi:hypothetical protein